MSPPPGVDFANPTAKCQPFWSTKRVTGLQVFFPFGTTSDFGSELSQNRSSWISMFVSDCDAATQNTDSSPKA